MAFVRHDNGNSVIKFNKPNDEQLPDSDKAIYDISAKVTNEINYGYKAIHDMVDVLQQEMNRSLVSFMIDPVKLAKERLDKAKLNLDEAIKEESENNPNEHIHGEVQLCTYHERTVRCQKDYDDALETYNDYRRIINKQ